MENQDVTINIGNRLEPFWDHFLIERLDNAHLQMHAPVPRETVLQLDKPWEGPASGYFTVIQDGDLYRMYYRGLAGPNIPPQTCYAHSFDGIHFERPNLGQCVIDGSTNNNAIGNHWGRHNFTPFLDTNPDCRADQRFKALGSGRSEKFEQWQGLVAFASADGVHWSLIQDGPVITKGRFDSQNVAFWSEHENCYVSYYRVLTNPSADFRAKGTGMRTIGRATSKDFINWTDPTLMDFGDTPMEQLYTNATHPYFRAPHLYVALPKRFVPDRAALSVEEADRFGVHEAQRKGISELVFMTSRGGTCYDRTFMEAFIRPGTDRQNWVARSTSAGLGVVPTGPKEMSLYLKQHNAQPSIHLRRFTLRTDGFASVRAPYRGGEMVTRPFTFTGDQLTMNFATSAAGSVRVEVQAEDGRAAPGHSLDDSTVHFGDEVEQRVSWGERTDLSELAGKTVQLRFVMSDADVYAIRFR